jgi:hypothetical protein
LIRNSKIRTQNFPSLYQLLIYADEPPFLFQDMWDT